MINRNRRFTIGHRLVQTGLAVLVWLMGSPSLVYAHGAMAGEDLGRPFSIAGALAFISYWAVILWPRRS